MFNVAEWSFQEKLAMDYCLAVSKSNKMLE